MNINPDTEKIERCILCPDAATKTDDRFGALLGLRSPYGVRRCMSCGLRWLSPRPTPEAYVELYSYENYFSGLGAVEDYALVAKQRSPYFAKRIELMESRFEPGKALSILDIGAATGEFVHQALGRGHHAEGLELSEGARRRAYEQYGIELLDIGIETLQAHVRYDVVHMNHVLEHMADPAAVIGTCAGLLKSGGLLVIEVPQQIDNDLDRLKRLLQPMRRAPFNAYSLHHTYFFTPDSLTRLLEEGGFDVVSVATSNKARTPLWPFKARNWILRGYLGVSDAIHRGGNIIEVCARLSRGI